MVSAPVQNIDSRQGCPGGFTDVIPVVKYLMQPSDSVRLGAKKANRVVGVRRDQT